MTFSFNSKWRFLFCQYVCALSAVDICVSAYWLWVACQWERDAVKSAGLWVPLSFSPQWCFSVSCSHTPPQNEILGKTFFLWGQLIVFLCRSYVISSLPKLLALDDRKITAEEREEARKIYGNRRFSIKLKRSKNSKEKVCQMYHCTSVHSDKIKNATEWLVWTWLASNVKKEICQRKLYVLKPSRFLPISQVKFYYLCLKGYES